MWEIISNNPIISGVVTTVIVAILGGIVAGIRKGWNTFKGIMKRHEEDHGFIKDTLIELDGKLGALDTKLESNSQSSIENDKLILKGKIQDIHERGFSKGYLGPKDKELANEFYDRYHALGGNGYIHTLITEINVMTLRR